MREFYFVNSIGQQIDLQEKAHLFKPTRGLGFSNKNEYEDLGNGFFQRVFGAPDQMDITGIIYFLESVYADWKTLIDWLFSGYEISFVYSPVSTEVWRCDVDLAVGEKTEMLEGSKCLIIPISMQKKTPWYKTTPTVINFALDDDTSYKIFPYRFPYVLSPSGSSKKVAVTAAGHYPARARITILGEISDPVITLLKTSTSEILGRVDLTGLTVAAGEQLQYSSVPGQDINGDDKSYIRLVGADGSITDLIDSISLSYNNFFELPVGIPCSVQLDFTGVTTTASIFIYEYRSTI